MTPALLLLRAALGDCGAGMGDAWDDVFGVVHQVGGAVLTAYGGGALVKPLTQLEQQAGLLPTPPSGKLSTPPAPAAPAAAKRIAIAKRPAAPSRAAALPAAAAAGAPSSPASAPGRHVKGATIAAVAVGALLLWRLHK